MWAAAPKPYNPRRSASPVILSDRDGKAEAIICHGVLRVTAVDLIPSKPGIVAQVFPPGEAVAAPAAGPTEPGHAYPVSWCKPFDVFAGLHHLAHDLVAGDQGQLGVSQLSVDHVQVGPAHAAGAYAHKDLLRLRLGRRNVGEA